MWKLYLPLLVTFALVLAYWASKSWKVKKWKALPWPVAWEKYLKNHMSLYVKLPSQEKEKLQNLVKVFFRQYPFEGCAGLKVTEEMKLLVAAQACLLLINRPVNLRKIYPKLDVILIYPSAYVAQEVKRHGWQVFTKEEQTRLGESWHQGMVILAWDHVLGQAKDLRGNHNVVLHEFAHQLDQEDGHSDGAPLLDSGKQYVHWAKHLGEVYKELQERVAHGCPSFLDPYGATNPAEFFAVTTETFFENPIALQKHYPKLYRELANYYQLDPVQW